MPPLDYALDSITDRLASPRFGHRTTVPAARPLEQPLVFDYTGLWQHTLPMLDMLRARYGHLPVDQLGGSYGWSVRHTQSAAYERLQINTLAEYIDAFRSGGVKLPYLRHLSLNRGLPALRPHIKDPAEFRPNWVDFKWLDRLGGPELFIGQRGTGFGWLHQDHASVHVGFVQLQGEKEFVLFPPTDGPNLYHTAGQQFPYQQRNSWLKFHDLENDTKYPLLRHTNPRRLVLKAGQALLMPADWWHTTLNLSDSVSYSIRIVNRTNIGRVIGQHLQGVGRLARKVLSGANAA